MEIKIIKAEKNSIHLELDNLTIAELLRKELWNDEAVEIAAWRREHPTKNPILILETKNKSAKKVLLDCIERCKKINEKLLTEFKKIKK